ncbi:MAG: hypothetical protein IPG45_25155 [Deltaproteobacteria bacterium]|jgi:C4-dicarboxylate-specific signal transduction histidine kinase|nr:hypothetical protein [Deltaproteobacteria bacterium]
MSWTRRRFPIVALGLGLVLFAVWAVQLVLEVSVLRQDVEQRVGWLRALDGRAPLADQDRRSLVAELEREGHLDALGQEALQTFRDNRDPAATTGAALILTQQVRRQTAAISSTLGGHWSSINLLVALALGLAATTLVLFVRTQQVLTARDRAEAEARRVAEENARLAAARLEDSQQTFHEVLGQLPDGVLIAQDGRVVRGNAAAHRLLGEDVEDRPLEGLLGPEAVAAGEPRAIDQGKELGGKRRILEIYGPCAIQLEGQPATLHLLRDVTAARQLAMRFRLNDRLAAVGTLAAGVAHEINNPLTFVGSNLVYAREALENLPGIDPKVRAELLDCLRDAAEGSRRVAMIAKDLKSFARPSDDLLGAVDVRQVLDSTINLVRSQLARIEVQRDYGTAVPAAANEARLGQIFVNLLTNAAQAMPPGHPSPWIKVRTRLDDGRVIIEVEDNGSGISPEVRERMFDPFFTTKEIGQGTGLGLYVTHRIVSELGGTIGVDSAVGVGTTFRISLPSAGGSPTRTAVASPQ